MNMSLILPWFPIVLVAGFGGRLLEHRRGLWLGIICAIFWIMLVQASHVFSSGFEAGTLVAILSGAAVIVAIGNWSGNTHPSKATHHNSKRVVEHNLSPRNEESTIWSRLDEEMYRFDDWLEDHSECTDIWGEFDEYVRLALSRLCHSSHVRPYRAIDHATGLTPLHTPDAWDDVPEVASAQGVLTRVMQHKSRYIKKISDTLSDEVTSHDSMASGPSWCFPILRGQACIGVIEIGSVGISELQCDAMLSCVERLIGLFWNAVHDRANGAHLGRTDPVSALPTREAFLQSAAGALKQSYQHNEPVAMVVFALERLRHLSDIGRWDSVDEIVRAASDVVRKKIRTDDCLCRFDGSRIVVLLRRVDTELTTLVATQLLERLANVVGDHKRWGGEVGVRCGVVSAETVQPDINTLLSHTLTALSIARSDGQSMIIRTAEDAAVMEATS